MYTQAYLTAESFVKKEEGGWYPGSSDPTKDSNPTMYGVIQKTYDTYRTNHNLSLQSVQLIAENEIEDIYYSYWLGTSCNAIEPISGKLAICMFDTGFNAGTHEAIKLLQMTVSTAQDGNVGPETLNFTTVLVNRDESLVLKAYMTNRYNYYQSLKLWPTYQHVWSNRMNALAVLVGIDWHI